MLSALVIQNFVLIEKLELDGHHGLCALTGETGAGKSILLDALGLALGARADAGFVRHGTEQAQITAAFAPPKGHAVFTLLAEKDIASEGDVILRRTLSKDGRSKAYINDAPVSVQFLKETGALLVEIHGQFDTQGLMDATTHRGTLDLYAGLTGEVKQLRAAYTAWRDAERKLDEAQSGIETLKMQEDYLRHAVNELDALSPVPGEEIKLAEKRTLLKEQEKLRTGLDDTVRLIDGENGLMETVGAAQASLVRLGDVAKPLADALTRVRAEVEEASFQAGKMQSGGNNAKELAAAEERYFTIRQLAKKHRCDSDALCDILEDMRAKLRLVTDHDGALADLEKAVIETKKAYVDRASKISEKRVKAAGEIAKSVQKELKPLKLEKATFHVAVTQMDESRHTAEGIDNVQFMAATNPGTPPAPLNKIASGGELSRFMLAIKAIIAADGAAPTLIFDEVDSGIGGATADAVGERLSALAAQYQVLVVTHSPQVAARAGHHWHIAKTEQKGTVITHITPLTAIKDRQEEIARMLSGATVTKEARAQAAQLLKDGKAA
ncbi:MAG: DNA repair protein RecN [Alphaproteobacteria bacterium]|nr:DNA repair protein RecN [Alphaproteobacteria bacterium]